MEKPLAVEVVVVQSRRIEVEPDAQAKAAEVVDLSRRLDGTTRRA